MYVLSFRYLSIHKIFHSRVPVSARRRWRQYGGCKHCVCVCACSMNRARLCVSYCMGLCLYVWDKERTLHVAAVSGNKNMLDVYKITDDVVTRNRYSDDNDDATLQRWVMIIHLRLCFSLYLLFFVLLSSFFFAFVFTFRFVQYFYVDRLFWSFASCLSAEFFSPSFFFIWFSVLLFVSFMGFNFFFAYPFPEL